MPHCLRHAKGRSKRSPSQALTALARNTSPQETLHLFPHILAKTNQHRHRGSSPFHLSCHQTDCQCKKNKFNQHSHQIAQEQHTFRQENNIKNIQVPGQEREVLIHFSSAILSFTLHSLPRVTRHIPSLFLNPLKGKQKEQNTRVSSLPIAMCKSNSHFNWHLTKTTIKTCKKLTHFAWLASLPHLFSSLCFRHATANKQTRKRKAIENNEKKTSRRELYQSK